jgi:hypothetical protein
VQTFARKQNVIRTKQKNGPSGARGQSALVLSCVRDCGTPALFY